MPFPLSRTVEVAIERDPPPTPEEVLARVRDALAERGADGFAMRGE